MAKSFPNTGATVGLAADRSALASPFAGMQFFEADTSRNWFYNGSTWIPDDGVFTTEAARDAAITSPTQGMHAYLTAPTTAIVDATGLVTAIPTGVQTIYDGSVWVVVTPVSACTTTSGTRASGAWGALTGGGTNPTVTIATGTMVRVSMSAKISNNISGNASQMALAVSGASTVGAGSFGFNVMGRTTSNYDSSYHVDFIATLPSPGVCTFTPNYVASTSTIGTFGNRSITITGIA